LESGEREKEEAIEKQKGCLGFVDHEKIGEASLHIYRAVL